MEEEEVVEDEIKVVVSEKKGDNNNDYFCTTHDTSENNKDFDEMDIKEADNARKVMGHGSDFSADSTALDEMISEIKK